MSSPLWWDWQAVNLPIDGHNVIDLQICQSMAAIMSSRGTPSRTRFAQMLAAEQIKRGQTDREVAENHGWLQQTFSRWKLGSLPRQHMFASIASFLETDENAVREMVEEAQESAASTKLPNVAAFNAARVYGRVTDRKDGKYVFDAFNKGRKRIPDGRYAILIDTKIMEPALPVGTRAWLDPAIWPSPGNEVLAHAKGGAAWIGRLVGVSGTSAEIERGGSTMTVRDVEGVHVIVLSERVARINA
ncbi:hypothetical protein GGE68_002985 [Rhizobium leguminosarum]|uniref:hypothetical protein n=1 Tax=Rhizobium leguminosarum TaxID=384 RepID=UPI0017FC4A5C|nr:hypothetical protein [Rhizobium leguminosarum]MBB5664788.1 hypothetical protein [Rhizobium leguminosarum]